MSRTRTPLPRNPYESAARLTESALETLHRSWVTINAGTPWGTPANQAVTDLIAIADSNDYPDVPNLHELQRQIAGHPLEFQQHVILSMQDQITVSLWQHDKTVYLMDEQMWEALADTEPSGTIPADVFRRLPHRNPYILFPHPFDTHAENGDQLRIEGVWITGRRDKRTGEGSVLCSTSHPDLSAISLLFYGYSLTPDGRPHVITTTTATGSVLNVRDSVLSRASIPLRDDTLERHIAGAVRRVARSSETLTDTAFTESMLDQNSLAALTRTTVVALVYLCSERADIQPRSVTQGRSRKGRGNNTPINVHPVGYRVGAALRAQHRSHADGSNNGPTGRTVAPHIRRAHFHTFRAGPGRTETIVRWLAPIPVKMTEPASTITVHRAN